MIEVNEERGLVLKRILNACVVARNSISLKTLTNGRKKKKKRWATKGSPRIRRLA